MTIGPRWRAYRTSQIEAMCTKRGTACEHHRSSSPGRSPVAGCFAQHANVETPYSMVPNRTCGRGFCEQNQISIADNLTAISNQVSICRVCCNFAPNTCGIDSSAVIAQSSSESRGNHIPAYYSSAVRSMMDHSPQRTTCDICARRVTRYACSAQDNAC